MGISESVWQELCTPRWRGHDLDETTPLYIDLHIALEVLHMPYPLYMQRTTPQERTMYRLYLALKSAKDDHARWHAEQEAETERDAMDAIRPPTDRGR